MRGKRRFGIKFKRERRIKKVPFLSGPDFCSQQVMNRGSDGCASAGIHVCSDEFVESFEVGFGRQKRYDFQHITPQHAIAICNIFSLVPIKLKFDSCILKVCCGTFGRI